MKKRKRSMAAGVLAFAMVMAVTAGITANSVHASEPSESVATGTDCDSFEAAAAGETLALSEANFPDAVFRECLKKQYDADGNGYINPAEVDTIDVRPSKSNGNIISLKGIELFPDLKELYCNGNQITQLDVSGNKNLVYLSCSENQLTQLDISKNENLAKLYCYNNQLTQLDISGNVNLVVLYCNENQIAQLDVSRNVNLEHLHCGGNQLAQLDVSNHVNLQYLYCERNQLTQLNVSGAPKLSTLHCEANQLTQLDVSRNVNLVNLYCQVNQLTQLDVSGAPKLSVLYCQENQLTQLDVSRNVNLGNLSCGANQLTQLDVSKNVNLKYLYCEENQLTQLDVSRNVNLVELSCGANQLTQLDVSRNTKLCDLDCENNYLKSVDTSNNHELTRFKFEPQKSNLAGDTVTAEGIYIAEASEKQIVAGMVAKAANPSAVEYSWYACKDETHWITVQDWTAANEWLVWTPQEYGDYVLVCKARIEKDDSTIVQSAVPVSYHPCIKGICQMPYTGEDGGYLIGVETYDNPNQSYRYELLILDCTLLAQGKDAWVYTTGKCNVSEGNAFWTVWQPQYGYYWTLFRVYDANGRLVDEMCYGFENVY